MAPGVRDRIVPAAPDGTARQQGGRQDTPPQFELTEKIHAYDPKADTALIDAAYVFATQAHGAQKRDNGDP